MRTGFADIICCSSSSENDATYESLRCSSLFKLFVNGKFTECYNFLMHRWTYFLLFLSAHFSELRYFGFASLRDNSRLCSRHFSYHGDTDAKYITFGVSQSSERQRDHYTVIWENYPSATVLCKAYYNGTGTLDCRNAVSDTLCVCDVKLRVLGCRLTYYFY